MASFDQKLRTLYLMEILLERTDDEHMLNASELCTILDQEYGISTDRRTIYTEMEILDKFGLDIQQKKGKIPRHTGQNAITEGDLECILTIDTVNKVNSIYDLTITGCVCIIIYSLDM